MLANLFRAVFAGRGKAVREQAPTAASLPDEAHAALAAGDYATALARFGAVVAADPGNYQALANQGLCHGALAQYAEAELCLNAVLQARPDAALAAMVRLNLGNVALATHRYTEACGHYEAALALSGPGPGLLNNLGMALHRRGLPEQAMARFRAALALQPDYQDAASNLLFSMQHCPSVPARELFDEFRAWSARHEAPLLAAQRPHGNSRDAARRLRIGYVSGDFRRHALANFVEPVLRHHDRGAVEVYCYATTAHADEQTAVLRGLADQWRDAAALSEAALADLVRQDAIDILVDLSSHTTGHRLLTFARKPAPVQMTWLGYPATTGLRSIDYRISDALSDPPGVADAWHSERLLRLPRTQWCYRPDDAAPPTVSPLPALSAGRITFGSFNNPAKLNDGVLRLWARVLAAVPLSRMHVVSIPDGPSRERMAETLIARGATPGQITVSGTLQQDEFWRVRDDIDIVLDAHPYNGTTTTFEALWSGLPVVTLAGSHGAARSAASILSALGLPELAAHDEASYVSIACALAGDLPRLAELRGGMRARFLAAGLCDGPRFARELEALYRSAWHEWCKPHGGAVRAS